jgi:tRNA A-37 threonylcarbamoyl transferase component Bud32
MTSRIFSAAGSLVDQIKINRLSRKHYGGRWYWFKQRRRGAKAIIAFANWFFRLAGNPVIILGQPTEWIEWEKACHTMLHGDEFSNVVDDTGALGVEEFPGKSVSDHLKDGTATLKMAKSAGRELSRAHQMSCQLLSGGWSHGDPHTGNFVYDPDEDRARLMDFEVRHDKRLDADRRHADDLLVFLQDTLGRLPKEEWLQWARAFIEAYDRPTITAHLLDRLTEPRGAARLWWAVRTTYLEPGELNSRLADLKTTLAA